MLSPYLQMKEFHRLALLYETLARQCNNKAAFYNSQDKKGSAELAMWYASRAFDYLGEFMYYKTRTIEDTE